MSIKIQTTSYVVFSNLKIILGMFGGSKSESKDMNIVWSPTKTTITGARLVIVAQTDQWYSDMIVHFGGQQIYRKDWGIGTETVNESIDVLPLLQNGVNSIAVTFEKPLAGATLTTSLALQIDFEGEPPKPEPDWLKYAVIGSVVIALILAIIRIRGRKR